MGEIFFEDGHLNLFYLTTRQSLLGNSPKVAIGLVSLQIMTESLYKKPELPKLQKFIFRA